MFLQIRMLVAGSSLVAQVITLTAAAVARAKKGFTTTQGFSVGPSSSSFSFESSSVYVPTLEAFNENTQDKNTYSKNYDTAAQAESARRRFIIGVSEFNAAIAKDLAAEAAAYEEADKDGSVWTVTPKTTK